MMDWYVWKWPLIMATVVVWLVATLFIAGFVRYYIWPLTGG